MILMQDKSELFRSIIFSYGTKISGLAINLVYFYIIANYLGPELYGLFNYFSGFSVTLASVIGVLLLQDALNTFIPQTKSLKLFKKLLKWQYFLALPLFLIILLFADKLVLFIGKPYPDLLLLGSILILFTPVYSSYLYVFKGFKRFGKILKITTVENLLNLILAIVFAVWLRQGIYGVFYAKFIATSISIILFTKQYRNLAFSRKEVNFLPIKNYLKNSAIFNIVKPAWEQVILILMGLFVSPVALGVYYIVQKLILYTLDMPKTALSDALFPYMSENATNTKLLEQYTSKNIKLSIIISLVLGSLIALASPLLFDIFFKQYQGTQSLVFLFMILNVVCSMNALGVVYTIVNRIDLLNRAMLLGFITLIVSGFALVPSFSTIGLLLSLNIATLVKNMTLMYYLKRLSLKIDMIPRLNDIIYFTNVIRGLIKIKHK